MCLYTKVANTIFSATFDVQALSVQSLGGEIAVSAEFITNTAAQGSFIVLQSDDGSPDQFRILLRDESKLTVSDRITVPPSSYSVYVYDLEEDGLPHTEPAIGPTGEAVKINFTAYGTFYK